LDPAKVSYFLRGSEETFRKCFMRSMGSRGAVAVRFVVEPTGSLSQATVVWSTIGSPLVDECLLEHVRAQRFGEASQKLEASWTFVFRLSDPIDDAQREKLLKEADAQEHDALRILPRSSGTIEANQVHEIVQARYPLYAHCYRDSIGRRGESRGLVRFELDIDEQGQPRRVQDAGSILPDAFAVDCVAEAFYAMRFPKPSGGAVAVEVALEFD
jgi:TonB family protein